MAGSGSFVDNLWRLFKIHGELSKPNVVINLEVKKLVCAFVNTYYHAKLNNTIRKISKNRIDGNNNNGAQNEIYSDVDQSLLIQLFETCKIAQDILKGTKFDVSETTEANPKKTTDASTMTTTTVPITATKETTSPTADTVYRPKYSFKCLACINRRRIRTKDASTTMRVKRVRERRTEKSPPQATSDDGNQRANGETDVQNGTSVIMNPVGVNTDRAFDAVRKESVIMSAPCMQNRRSMEFIEDTVSRKTSRQSVLEAGGVLPSFTPTEQSVVDNQLYQPTAPLTDPTWTTCIDNNDFIDVVTVDEPENESIKSVITRNLATPAPQNFKQYPVMNQIPNFGFCPPTAIYKPSAAQLRDDNFNFTVRQSLFLQAMSNFHAAFPLSLQPNSRTSLTNVVSTQKVPSTRANKATTVKPQEFPRRRRCAKRKTGMHTTAILC